VRETQSITFGAPGTKTYGDAPFNAGAVADSGLTVTYANSNPNVATNDGPVFYIVGAGTNLITASQAGNAFYYAAPGVTNVLVVTPKVLTFHESGCFPTRSTCEQYERTSAGRSWSACARRMRSRLAIADAGTLRRVQREPPSPPQRQSLFPPARGA
jgi:hypothetical protein